MGGRARSFVGGCGESLRLARIDRLSLGKPRRGDAGARRAVLDLRAAQAPRERVQQVGAPAPLQAERRMSVMLLPAAEGNDAWLGHLGFLGIAEPKFMPRDATCQYSMGVAAEFWKPSFPTK